MNDLMSWPQFLAWLTTPTAIPVVVGILLSILAEYIPAYEALAARWKRAVFFGASILVPMIGALLGIATLGWDASWQGTFWPAIMAGVLAFGSGTLTHLRRLPAAPSFE